MLAFRMTLTLLFFLISLSSSAFSSGSLEYVEHSEPTFLSFEELRILSANPFPGGVLEEKLDRFWHTPIIDNEAYYRGVRGKPQTHPKLGPFMRVASWNIEKSMGIDDALQLLTASSTKFNSMIDLEKVELGSKDFRILQRQRERLRNADIFILQEMEIGIKRSQYKNAAAELAKALNMNYAYGAQYLEVDPLMLGLEELEFEDDDAMEIREDVRDYYKIDSKRYKGVFGSAVLSKYPIKNVTLVPLKTKPYDWYENERVKVGTTETFRRIGTKILFKNAIQRELKVGNRHFFRVDLEVPGLPDNTLTVVNIHLEIKCEPEDREAQAREILTYISDIRNPVVVMGDFNMSSADLSPTTAARVLKRTAKNPTTWLNLGISAVAPHALLLNTTRGISNVTKNFNDPTAKHVPVIAPNPMRSFFDMMEQFRFQDGMIFDFRGDKKRSTGKKSQKLANSNQRGTKGFVTTFRVIRPLGIVGKYRLDWAFVKSFSTRNESSSSYQFAPHFAETLEELNTSLKIQISDHHPSVIDLPFEEPKI